MESFSLNEFSRTVHSIFLLNSKRDSYKCSLSDAKYRYAVSDLHEPVLLSNSINPGYRRWILLVILRTESDMSLLKPFIMHVKNQPFDIRPNQ